METFFISIIKYLGRLFLNFQNIFINILEIQKGFHQIFNYITNTTNGSQVI